MVSLVQLTTRAENPLPIAAADDAALSVFYVLCGVAILYSLMIALSATSIWLGQNRSLYDFWFYITNFSRYPMEIYDGRSAAAAVGVHVHRSRAGRGERAGPAAGPAALSENRVRLGPGGVHAAGDRRDAVAVAVVVSDGAEQLSQRKFLAVGADLLVAIGQSLNWLARICYESTSLRGWLPLLRPRCLDPLL